jgi:phosphoribosyl 1,2-cyclic phosphate phosphodiesterase
LENLKKRFDYIFESENKYPGAPSVQTFIVSNDESFTINNTAIIPIEVDMPTFRFLATGFRILYI